VLKTQGRQKEQAKERSKLTQARDQERLGMSLQRSWGKWTTATDTGQRGGGRRAVPLWHYTSKLPSRLLDAPMSA
jgi:hypothetical protein